MQAETLAVKYSLQRVADLGMTKIVLETDASIVGRALISTDFDRSPNRCLFRQIHELMMSQFAFILSLYVLDHVIRLLIV